MWALCFFMCVCVAFVCTGGSITVTEGFTSQLEVKFEDGARDQIF